MTESIKCMDCPQNIKTSKKIGIEFIPKLEKDERLNELNELIKKQNFDNIHSCICATCFNEYLPLMKEKIEEEKNKHNKSIISLKDLLLDLSNQESIDEIIKTVLNDNEIRELQAKYQNLKRERIQLEHKLINNKKELKNLKNEEEETCIKLNKNLKEREENKEICEKLKLKLIKLQKEYEELVKDNNNEDK